jgi:hypothetical protein
LHADARRRITLYKNRSACREPDLSLSGLDPVPLSKIGTPSRLLASLGIKGKNGNLLVASGMPVPTTITYCTPVTVPPSSESLQTTPECPVILSGAQSRVLHLLGLILEVRRGRGSRGSSLVVEMDPPAPAVVPKLCLFPSSGQMPALGGRGVQMFLLCDRCVVYVRSILQSAPYC